jgi:penicillin-binding protein 1B
MARRAGLNDSIGATPAVALGSYETTPLEMAGAYTLFANQGQVVKPTLISQVLSNNRAVLYRYQPQPHKALDPRVTWLMVNMMEDVLRYGTAAGVRARGFALPAAGKTGTSRDGWFAGFTSELLCVVWVGFDDGHELGLEGAKSALPIWTEFMKRAGKMRPWRDARPFKQPSGIRTAQICVESGQLAAPSCPKVRSDYFIDGTEPAVECQLHWFQQNIADRVIDESYRTNLAPKMPSQQ